jgi:hypothetical protein
MPVINVDRKIAWLVLSMLCCDRYSRAETFMSLPNNGQGVSEDDDSRIEPKRVDYLSAYSTLSLF